jgi:hypothetical protein
MGTTRSNVSRFERRKLGRSKLATIAAYVEALGGTLHLVADARSASAQTQQPHSGSRPGRFR